MRAVYEIAAMFGISGCYLCFHHTRWVRHLVYFAASHDLDERDRHYRRWSFVAALGMLPSCGALIVGLFLMSGILPKAHRGIYLYAYLFVWLVSLVPTMVFVFHDAGPKLGELGYPGYRKNQSSLS